MSKAVSGQVLHVIKASDYTDYVAKRLLAQTVALTRQKVPECVASAAMSSFPAQRLSKPLISE